MRQKYTISKALYENDTSIVYRAERNSDLKPVIIKQLKASAQTEEMIRLFLNEQKLLSGLNSKNVVRLIETSAFSSQYIHVFEDIGGSTLFDILTTEELRIHTALEIALRLAQTLRYVHYNEVLHGDITPKNIIYNVQTEALQLIDFSQSVRLSKDPSYEHRKQASGSGSLLYIAPEQTGLTEDCVDLRSDLYSLGVSLYHLFLGHSPFDARDKYELTHKQIAFTPPPLHTVNPKIPQVLSAIVQKLIEKKLEQRYQSDEGLIYDLNRCVRTIDKDGRIEEFEIATRDYHGIDLSQELFGRDREIALLKKAYDKTFASRPLIVLISGHSGIGKSRLAEEFFGYFDTRKIHVVKTGFEPYQSSVPYLCFKQLFAQIATAILSQDRPQHFAQMPPDSAKLLSHVFAELKHVFPGKETDPEAPTADLNARLPLALKSFFECFATSQNPTIIYIDNLQWADAASADLLQRTLVLAHNPHLHLVVSFRDDEIQNNPAASALLAALEGDGAREKLAIALGALKENDLKNMLRSLLACNEKSAVELAAVVHRKTDGNPFCLSNFINYLLDEKELYFKKGKWKFSLEKIKESGTSLTMATMNISRFTKLTRREQSYLQHLSLLGNNFDITVFTAMMQSLGFEPKLMEKLKRLGFIDEYVSKCRFTHDKIQEYVFDSMDASVRRKVHFDIGRYLEKAARFREDISNLVITGHLNNAYVHNKLPARLFKLNIKALEEALNKNAYALALQKSYWIEKHLYHEALWKKERNAVFFYRQLAAKCLYLNGEHEKAFEQISALADKAQTLEERLLCFSLLKDICVTQGKYFETLLELARALFDKFGLKIPATQALLSSSVTKLQEKITLHPMAHEPSGIMQLPPLKNEQKKLTMSFLEHFWEVCYYLHDLNLMRWSYLNIIDISFRYGNTGTSSFGYALYGAELTARGQYKTAGQFGDVALKLNRSLDDLEMLPKVHNFVANFINPYTNPWASNVALYAKSLRQSKCNGNIVFGTWANFLMHLSDFFSGTNIHQLQKNISHESSFIRASGDAKMIAVLNVLRDDLNALQGISSATAADENVFVRIWKEENFYPALAWYAIIKAQHALLCGRIDEGLEYLQKHVHSTDNAVIMFPKIRLHFVRALLLLGKETARSEEEEALLRLDLEEYGHYSAAAPAVFRFKKLLLKAETMKNTASQWDTAKAYDASLSEAYKRQNNFFIALGALCASRFFKRLGLNDLSHSYLNKASLGLEQWGAQAVLSHLKTSNLSPAQTPLFPVETAEKLLKCSDVYHVLKSFTTIAYTKDKKELLGTLMQTIMENATASKAVLILKEEGEFFIKADIDFASAIVRLQSTRIEETDMLPRTLIAYAINTAQALSIKDPADKGDFRSDAYIKTHKPASSLVIPIRIEGSVSALLYLENKELNTPFSEEKMTVLELLVTQAAIVYSNTALIETLQQSKKNLDKAQEIAHIGSWEFEYASQRVIWSAETYKIYDMEPFSETVDMAWFVSHLYPEDLDYIEKSIEKAFADPRGNYDVTHRIITAKGEQKLVRQRAKAYLDGDVKKMSGTITDITQRRESEELILRLSQLVDQNPFSTFITDTMGHIEYANAEAIRATGYSHEELMGNKMNIFRSQSHSSAFYQEMWSTIKEQKSIWRGMLINKMKDGSLRDCSSTIFPLFDSSNAITSFVTIQEDATERNIKDKLFLMQSRQAQMGEMVSMIAHQWRQPLSIIMALINKERMKMILEKASMEEMVLSYDDIESQVMHLSKTISDFRDFFKPDKEPTLSKSSTIISKSFSLARHMLKQSSIEVTFEYRADSSFVTFEREVEQVFLNLISNAKDALVERGIKKPQIDIVTDEQDDYAVITVEDNAMGITEEVMETLFLPYVSTKNKQNGTGLGLYMSKTIIEEHCHGSIRVVNTDKGAKFTVCIPLKDKNA
ncbi:MAG: AAA family ATPase [Campylobacterales bacterium]|nr:AAA family ATPase [Campylobacterales bacterium]